jgi:uncharacterized repeat protein (TIGR03833 family)
MITPTRAELQIGMKVEIIEKKNQPSGILTIGVIQRILTKSPTHPHGIKVMLMDGKVGRVQHLSK